MRDTGKQTLRPGGLSERARNKEDQRRADARGSQAPSLPNRWFWPCLKRSAKVSSPPFFFLALLPQATAGIVMTDARIDTPQQKNHRPLGLLQPSTADLCVDLGDKF